MLIKNRTKSQKIYIKEAGIQAYVGNKMLKSCNKKTKVKNKWNIQLAVKVKPDKT